MRKLRFIILIFCMCFLSKIKAQNAKEIFLDNLTSLEKIVTDKNEIIHINKFYQARTFLTEITGIKYEIEKAYDRPIRPSKEILKAWRDWFEKNNENLYWDEKTQEVKVRR